jgi:hypothetical protein
LYEKENFSNDSEDYMVNYDQYETLNNYETDQDTKVKDLKNYYPSRNTFTFDCGIKISSQFDAGNLMSCTQIQEERPYLA